MAEGVRALRIQLPGELNGSDPIEEGASVSRAPSSPETMRSPKASGFVGVRSQAPRATGRLTSYYFDNNAELDRAVCEIIEAIPNATEAEKWTLMDRLFKLGERAFGKFMGFVAEIDDPRIAPTLVNYFVDFAAWLKNDKNFRGIGKVRDEILREAQCPTDPKKAKCEPKDFASIQQFFIRYLKDGLRSFPANPDIAGSPVDGKIANQGPIGKAGQAIEVKGERINFVKLAALNADEIPQFEGGQYVDIYLAPYNYHRYHSPFPGSLELTELQVVGGRERPVMGDNREILERNVRVVAKFKDEQGKPFIMVFVSATAVSRIQLFGHLFEPQWTPNYRKVYSTPEDFKGLFGREDITVKRGDDLGAFHLGSTVVLLAPKGTLTFDNAAVGKPIKLGEPIGH